MRQGDFFDETNKMIDLDRGAVELDNQKRLSLARIAGMDKILRRLDRGVVHHFHAARNNAGRDNAGDAGRRRLAGVKCYQQRAGRFRCPKYPHGDLGHDAKHSLRADDKSEEIVARLVEMAPAEPDDLAGHQHHLAAQDIVGGKAVFETMHAAGIFRDVAADRAGDLRGGIRRVIESAMLDRAGDGKIGDAGLDDREPVVEIYLFDFVEFHHGKENAVRERKGAAGKRGPGAARHHLHIVFVTIGEHGAHVRDAVGQNDDHGQGPVGGQAVAFVGPPTGLLFDDAFARNNAPQRGDDFCAPRENGCIDVHRFHFAELRPKALCCPLPGRIRRVTEDSQHQLIAKQDGSAPEPD